MTELQEETLFLQSLADDNLQFMQTPFDGADTLAFHRAGQDFPVDKAPTEDIVFNTHEAIKKDQVLGQYFVNPKDGDITSDPNILVVDSFEEVQRRINQVITPTIAKKLGLHDPKHWEMLSRYGYAEDGFIGIECYWRLNEQFGRAHLWKKKGILFNEVNLDRSAYDRETIGYLYRVFCDSIAFEVQVVLAQNESNIEEIEAAESEERERAQQILTQSQLAAARNKAAADSRRQHRESKLEKNLSVARKGSKDIQRAQQRGQKDAKRRKENRKTKHAAGQEENKFNRVANVNAVESSNIELPEPEVIKSNYAGTEFYESIKEKLSSLITPEISELILRVSTWDSTSIYKAKVLTQEERDKLMTCLDGYLEIMSLISASEEDLFPREVLFNELESHEEILALESVFAFELARESKWPELIAFKRQLQQASGLIDTESEKEVNPDSAISLSELELDIGIFSMQQGLDRKTEDGEIFYQSSLSLGLAFKRVIDQTFQRDEISPKRRTTVALNLLTPSTKDNFEVTEKWQEAIQMHLAHILNVIQYFGTSSSEKDSTFLIKRLCASKGRPNQKERKLTAIMAGRARNEASIQSLKDGYLKDCSGITDEGV